MKIFRKQNKEIVFYSPVKGNVIPISKVKDLVFSQKLIGDGFAVEPFSNKIYSPIKGKISSVFPTRHAIGLVTSEGIEVLLHLGIDTVELDGKPFKVMVSVGQQVTEKDLLIIMDRTKIKNADKLDTVMVIITQPNLVSDLPKIDQKFCDHSEEIFSTKIL